MLDGEKEATFPVSGKRMYFQRKSSADPGFPLKFISLIDTQLMSMVAYFEERYAVLGIRTERLEFAWRNITQAVLIAKINPSGENCSGAPTDPILMLDHYDTAFCEDIFNETGRRVSTKGADDNVSATTTLLQVCLGIPSNEVGSFATYSSSNLHPYLDCSSYWRRISRR